MAGNQVFARTGTVQDGAVVLDKPIPVADGTEIVVSVLVSPKPDKMPTDEEMQEFRNQPAIGMWADREDMKDSVAWVNKERAKWRQRSQRQE